MNVEPAEVALAYTYAWWLTGSAAAARTAVLAAVDRPDVPGADADLRVEILLRRVRAAAIAEPTMCPASELALLHDAIGLGLDAAAGLALIDARDARTELAHGRLEALGAGATFEITEPERLGGLAVGNPADVAAARQNPQLAALREAIFEGRDELLDVSRVEVPTDLIELIATRQAGHTDGVPVVVGDDDWFRSADRDPASADSSALDEPGSALDAAPPAAAQAATGPPKPTTSRTPTVRTPQRSAYTELPGVESEKSFAEEIDLTTHLPDAAPAPSTPSQHRINVVWLLVGMVVLVGVVVLLTSGGDGVVPGGEEASDDQVAGDGDTPTAAAGDAATPSAAATPADPSDGGSPGASAPPVDPSTAVPPADGVFELADAGVAVGIGTDPDSGNPQAGPFDPISVTVAYTGAEEDDALLVGWSVDGAPFDSERADLSPLLESARFSKQVPEAGWPIGQHILTFTLERTGEVVGEARFEVIDPADGG